MSFELIAYHLSKSGLADPHWVRLFLAFGTACGAVASLVLGKLYDRVGFPVILVTVLLTSVFSPLYSWADFTWRFSGWRCGAWVRSPRTCC
jgi:hypothetical protein